MVIGGELREEVDDEVEFLRVEKKDEEIVDGSDSGNCTSFEKCLEMIVVLVRCR